MGYPMISPTPDKFEGCNLRELRSEEIVSLSRCLRLDCIRMDHRGDATVDLLLLCVEDDCVCAKALKFVIQRKPSPNNDRRKGH